MNFTFAYKPMLLLIFPIALWAYLKYKNGSRSLNYSLTHKLSKFSGTFEEVTGRLPLILRTGALVIMVLAAARPQLYNMSTNTRSSGVDIVLCLDASGTMRAQDFTLNGERVTRLTAVKKVVGDFIKKREHDRIGLVVFGTEAYTQSPLTMDKGLLLALVDKLDIGMAGDRTAVGSAIAVGGKRLKDLEAKSKILILLTDGRNNTGNISPEQAAEAVKVFGVKIYAIGVGGKGPAPVVEQTPFGPRLMYIQEDLDEEALQKIAGTGNGRYFRASDSKELAEIYDIIDKAEKTEIKQKEYFNYKELYLYFLIPAFILMLIEIILTTTIIRIIP
jgi:Ca-activated chloride channel homolog